MLTISHSSDTRSVRSLMKPFNAIEKAIKDVDKSFELLESFVDEYPKAKAAKLISVTKISAFVELLNEFIIQILSFSAGMVT